MPSSSSGVLVIDKPRGCSSHDVVAQARRLLGRRDIGHAGTLDPMATGVLLLLVGQACKLSGYLTSSDKRYAAEITFGSATDTLDAEGRVVQTSPVDAALMASERVAEALAAERERRLQHPPSVSALKVDGRRAYALARRGEPVKLAPRDVWVRKLALLELDPPRLSCELLVSKGYYVRALARDLGQALGLPAHISALRRLASGAFRIEEATAWPAADVPPLIPLASAAMRALPAAEMTSEGAARARSGKRLGAHDFITQPEAEGPIAFVAGGELVALGTLGEAPRVLRGFVSEP
jgi:tRNA pseudouridine55 synthase